MLGHRANRKNIYPVTKFLGPSIKKSKQKFLPESTKRFRPILTDEFLTLLTVATFIA